MKNCLRLCSAVAALLFIFNVFGNAQEQKPTQPGVVKPVAVVDDKPLTARLHAEPGSLFHG